MYEDEAINAGQQSFLGELPSIPSQLWDSVSRLMFIDGNAAGITPELWVAMNWFRLIDEKKFADWLGTSPSTVRNRRGGPFGDPNFPQPVLLTTGPHEGNHKRRAAVRWRLGEVITYIASLPRAAHQLGIDTAFAKRPRAPKVRSTSPRF